MRNLLSKIDKPALIFLLGVLVATVTTKIIAHGGNTNLIHSCIRNSSGTIRIISANDSCNSSETVLDWPKQAGNNSFPLICLMCSYSTSDGVNFWAEYLRGKDLTGAMLPQNAFGAEEGTANMSNTNFTNAYLANSSFHNSNLTNVNFTNTKILNSDFNGANLTNTNFTGADLTGAFSMDTTNSTGIIWSNTICPDGTNSDNNGNTCEGHL